MENHYQFEEEYRDTISTVDESGKRIWIYPKKPKGAFHHKRIIVTVVLLSIFFAGPFLTIGDHPLLLLNLFDREFIILGQPFWPQDFFLLALLLVTFFVFIILFTVVFGRIWCGWACPQTLFMEMVFRKIEYWIEGDANSQRRLNQAPWNTRKIIKKVSKQLIFLLISLLISHTVMAYLVGIEELLTIISHPPTERLSGFIGLMVFTGIFYWVFAYLREQACTTVCPYGRLQGVLLVKDSIAVMYDWMRGEPRERIKKEQDSDSAGDCIDCKLCVHVCPTGIDIRNGTQLECVNCTACIDVCDEVMTKVGRPTGLIRYASYQSISSGIKKLFNLRVVGYTVVLVALISLLTFLLVSREDIEVTILRVPGTLYEKTDDGTIKNLYNIYFLNKTFEEKSIKLRLQDIPNASIKQIGTSEIKIPAGGKYEGVFMVMILQDQLQGITSKIRISVSDQNQGENQVYKTKFLGPAKFK